MKAIGNDRLFQKQMTLIGLCMLLQEILFFVPAYTLDWLLYPYLETVLTEANAYVAKSLIDGASYLCAFFIPALVLRQNLVPNEGIPFLPVVTREVFLFVPAATAMIFAASSVNTALLPAFYAEFANAVFWEDAASSNFQIVLSFISTALIPGVCEEFLFRGAVQTSLRPFGRSVSVVGSALLFGLMHANAGQFFYAFCAGIILGLLRDKTGSLWPGMVVHIFNNAWSVFGGALYERLEPKTADMILYAADAFILALGVFCMLLLFKKSLSEKAKKEMASEEGNFGVVLPSAPSYTPYPLESGRALRLSVNVPMIFFLTIAVGRAVLYLVVAYFGWY